MKVRKLSLFLYYVAINNAKELAFVTFENIIINLCWNLFQKYLKTIGNCITVILQFQLFKTIIPYLNVVVTAFN